MLKKLLIVLLIIVFAAIGLSFYALSNLNSFIASYKPELESYASKTLGSKVTIGELKAGLFPSPEIHLIRLASESPENPAESFRLEDMYLTVKLLPLFSKRIEVSALKFEKPAFIIIKDQDGTRVAGVPAPKKKQPASPGSDKADRQERDKTAESGSKPQGEQLPFDVSLESCLVSGAQIEFQDRIASKTYHVTNLNLSSGLDFGDGNLNIHNLELSALLLGKIKITVSAPKASAAKSFVKSDVLKISIGSNKLDASVDYSIKDKSGVITINSSAIDLALLGQLEDIVPQAAAIALAGSLAPDFKININKSAGFEGIGTVGLHDISASAGSLGVSKLVGKLAATLNQQEQKLRSETLKFRFADEDMSMTLNLSMSDNILKAAIADLAALGGSTNSSLTLKLEQPPRLSASLQAGGISIERAANIAKIASDSKKITGTVKSLKMDLGALMGEQAVKSLKANGALELSEFELRGFNLAASVLKSIKGLPFLSQALFSEVPPEFHEALTEENTAFSSVKSDFSVTDSVLNSPQFTAVSKLYTLEAAGKIGYDAAVELKATITFEREFSEALLAKVKELKAILNNNNQLVVPIAISGKAPKLIVTPNLEKLLKLGAGRMLEEGAGKLLEKALGGKNEEAGKALRGILGF